MVDPRDLSDAQVLARLRVLAGYIERLTDDRQAAYDRRFALWRVLLDRKVPQAEIAEASRVGVPAVRFAVFDRRQRAASRRHTG